MEDISNSTGEQKRYSPSTQSGFVTKHGLSHDDVPNKTPKKINTLINTFAEIANMTPKNNKESPSRSFHKPGVSHINKVFIAPEIDIVASCIKCAKRDTIEESRMEANCYWETHANELICDLCGKVPDKFDEDYWGECPRIVNVNGTGYPKSIMFCPKCLFSDWYLYRPGSMKVAQPGFTDSSTTLAQMRWGPVSQIRTMKYLDLHIKHAQMQLLPHEILNQLNEQAGIKNVDMKDLPFHEQQNYDQVSIDDFSHIEHSKDLQSEFNILNPLKPHLRLKYPDEHTVRSVQTEAKPPRQQATLMNQSFSELCRIITLVYNRYKYTWSTINEHNDFSAIDVKSQECDDTCSEHAVARSP